MKTLLKVVIAILIVAALCFGIYCVLPETPQMFIKGNVQYRINDEAKTHVDKIRNTKVPNSNATFGNGLENLCKSTAWYYEGTNEENWTVTFYGSKATFNFTNDTLPDSSLEDVYTDVPFKMVFSIREGSNVDISMSIKGTEVSEASQKIVYQKIANAAN